jgi:hypothetical protein
MAQKVIWDVVWGVVFNIAASEKSKLDKAEGLGGGYNAHSVAVMTPSGAYLKAASQRPPR